MGNPIARQGDQVVAVDTHIVMVPTPGGPVPTPLPHPFSGQLDGALSSSVKANGKAVATVDSTATNQPSHIPTPPGTSFQKPPANKGTVMIGSAKPECPRVDCFASSRLMRWRSDALDVSAASRIFNTPRRLDVFSMT